MTFHRDGKNIKANAAQSRLSAAAAGWLNQHPAFNEGTVDLRMETGAGNLRLLRKSPIVGRQWNIVFAFDTYATFFPEYAPDDCLGWVFTYGIFFDLDRDTVISAIPKDAFNYNVVKAPDLDNRIECRVEFEAEVPS